MLSCTTLKTILILIMCADIIRYIRCRPHSNSDFEHILVLYPLPLTLYTSSGVYKYGSFLTHQPQCTVATFGIPIIMWSTEY